MPTNPYFRHYSALNEQGLIEDLVIESIRQWGYDLFYLPREGNTPDSIFNEDASAKYTSHHPIEMYINSVDGFEGDGQFMSKFGIELRHQITLTVAIRTFTSGVGDAANLPRPLEGDLIYFPMDHKLFVIKNVDKYSVFYQTGALQSYSLICEAFEYAGEKLETGIPEVDAIDASLSLSTLEHALRDGNGDLILDANGKPQFDPLFDIDDVMDNYADNTEIDVEAAPLIDATDDNFFSETF